MMYALYTIWTERSTEMSESARQELRGKLFWQPSFWSVW
jgi:hypothetical protein